MFLQQQRRLTVNISFLLHKAVDRSKILLDITGTFFVVVPSCVFKLKKIVIQQCLRREGLTIELILSGDPEEWPLDPIPGKVLLFGELQALTAAVELLFLLPLFRPS